MAHAISVRDVGVNIDNYVAEVIKKKSPVSYNYLYQDDKCVVYDELNPQAPVHFLVVPKKLITKLSNISEDNEKLLAHLLSVARKMAAEKGMQKTGYHVMYAEDYQEAKKPIAIHVFGRALHHMVWPVGPGTRL